MTTTEIVEEWIRQARQGIVPFRPKTHFMTVENEDMDVYRGCHQFFTRAQAGEDFKQGDYIILKEKYRPGMSTCRHLAVEISRIVKSYRETQILILEKI